MPVKTTYRPPKRRTTPGQCNPPPPSGGGKNEDRVKKLLTRELAEKIAALLRAGNYQDTAAASLGIGRRTFYDWRERGAKAAKANDPAEANDPDGLYQYFFDLLEQARAEAQTKAVSELLKGGLHWQRWAWWLERSFPRLWGRVEYRGDAEGAENERDLAEQAKKQIIDTLSRMEKRTEALKNET